VQWPIHIQNMFLTKTIFVDMSTFTEIQKAFTGTP
jgi:hypothetical protein